MFVRQNYAPLEAMLAVAYTSGNFVPGMDMGDKTGTSSKATS
jgi:hypothetical protein